MKERTFFCIDMKTFYASVECAERGLDPFTTNLVVADLSRGKNALCLAITPKMKSYGIRNRCRLSEIPAEVKYEVAIPRMKLYVDYAADIYDLYLDYFSPKDIHVYSIDEAFIDATDYLKLYNIDKFVMAQKLLNEISDRFKIPATAGIGTNLYLAKIALDISAKHKKSRYAYLDEETYISTLWEHRPITDFWMVAKGYQARLASHGMYTMKDVALAPQELLYKIFGVNAEILIDHAWGREPCLISDIKSYDSKSKSVSFSQILPRNYTYDEAKTVLIEMVIHGAERMMYQKVVTDRVGLYIGYGDSSIPSSKGMVKMSVTTSSSRLMTPYFIDLYERIAAPDKAIRQIGLEFADVVDESQESFDLLIDPNIAEKERRSERAVMNLKEKYGRNSVLRGINYVEEATQRERNEMIGGHRAGYDDDKRES